MRILVALVVSALLAVPAVASQEKTAAEAPKSGEERARLALEIVGDALGTVASLEVPGNRLRVQVTAALAVWSHDRALARRALSDAAATIVAAFEEMGSKPTEKSANLVAARQSLLSQFIEKDPAAALDFLLVTRAAIPADVLAQNAEQETQLELQIAHRLVEASPERAAEIVERSAERGLPHGIVGVLSSLRAKDPARASALARKIAETAIASQIVDEGQTLYTVMELIRLELAARSGDASSSAQRPLLDDRTFRSLLDALVAAARALVSSPYAGGQSYMVVNLVSSLGEGMRTLDRFAPAQAQALRKLAETRSGDQPHVVAMEAARELQQAPVDDLLKRAETMPAGMRMAAYHQAATRLAAEGDLERAKQVVGEHISDPAQRASLLESLDRFAASRAIAEARFADALAAVETLGSIHERVQMLVQIAQNARAQGDLKSESQALERANAMLGERPRDAGELYASLILAGAFRESDSRRGLAILETCIDRINTLVDASAILEGFGCGDAFDRGELRVWEGGPMSGLATQTVEHLGQFAPSDLAAARAAAERFERPELRALAQLSVAAAALSDSQERTGERQDEEDIEEILLIR